MFCEAGFQAFKSLNAMLSPRPFYSWNLRSPLICRNYIRLQVTSSEFPVRTAIWCLYLIARWYFYLDVLEASRTQRWTWSNDQRYSSSPSPTTYCSSSSLRNSSDDLSHLPLVSPMYWSRGFWELSCFALSGCICFLSNVITEHQSTKRSPSAPSTFHSYSSLSLLCSSNHQQVE